MMCSHFTDLHEMLHTFQQHPVHLDECAHEFRFIYLTVNKIVFRQWVYKSVFFSQSYSTNRSKSFAISRSIVTATFRRQVFRAIRIVVSLEQCTPFDMVERKGSRMTRGRSSFDCGLRIYSTQPRMGWRDIRDACAQTVSFLPGVYT